MLAALTRRLWPTMAAPEERTVACGHRRLLLLALAAIAGCASGPAFVAPEPPGAEFRAVIYVYRAQAIPGSGIRHEVWVDAAKTVLLNGSWQRFEVFASPSTLAATGRDGWPSATSSRGTWVSSPDCGIQGAALRLTAGQVAYVQLELVNKTFELGGRYYFDYGCRFVQRSEAEALAVLPGLRRAGN